MYLCICVFVYLYICVFVYLYICILVCLYTCIFVTLEKKTKKVAWVELAPSDLYDANYALPWWVASSYKYLFTAFLFTQLCSAIYASINKSSNDQTDFGNISFANFIKSFPFSPKRAYIW